MREIKFRVWLPVHGRMSYAHTLREFIEMGNNSFSGSETFLQYTGLHDRNGKDIYEGDIVRVKIMGGYSNHYTDKEYLKVVEYDNNSARWKPFDRCRMWREEGRIELSAVEVIGNRFEHPHLLGEKGEGQG